jgi:uncharacterized protein (DUF433 family)
VREPGIGRFVGIGIYSIREASRLTGISPRSIRRWMLGYDYTSKGARNRMPPVVKGQLPLIGGVPALSFLDLQEVRCLQTLRSHGVSWHTLRLASERAREIVGRDHPFSTGRFRDDGRRILTAVAKDSGDLALEDIVTNQLGFEKVLRNFLKGLEFVEGQAARWFPTKDHRVVIDPARSFGQPVVIKEGVPTLVLSKAFNAERSLERVAEWYRVEVDSVKAAVAFEQRPPLAA